MNKQIVTFLKWLSHAFSEKDPLDGDMRFSIGRTSFVAWFWVVLVGFVRENAFLLTAPASFWLVGFSLLGYVIGREYLVLSFFQKNGNGNGNGDHKEEEPKDADAK